MTDPHIVTRVLHETMAYPAHDPRKASAEYTKVHHHLVYELDEGCWICGQRQSQNPPRIHNETHHAIIEWAVANAIDPSKLIADFPAMGEATDPALREFIDSEGGLLVLCPRHHRGGLYGIHSITYPAWVCQKYLRNGYDLATGQVGTYPDA